MVSEIEIEGDGDHYKVKYGGKTYRAPRVSHILDQMEYLTDDPNALLKQRNLTDWKDRKDLREGRGSADRYANRRADIGTVTHFQFISYLQQKWGIEVSAMGGLSGKVTAAMREKAELYFSYACDWEKDHKPRVIRGEISLFHPVLYYAGQADLICEIGGKFFIVDLKTYKSMQHTTKAQLAAYREALWHDDRFQALIRDRRRLEKWGWWEKPPVDYIHLGVLRVRDDGYQWKVIEPDLTLFFRCLMRHHRTVTKPPWGVHEDIDKPKAVEVI